MPRTVTINWGDGSPEQQWTGDKGTLDHVFPPSGTFTVTATPLDGGAPKTVGVTTPCGGGTVTATVACDGYTDPTGRTAMLTVTGATMAVTVDWGDGGYPETVTGNTAVHTYSADITGPQTIAITHGGAAVPVTGSPLTIPCGGSPSGVAAFAAGPAAGCVRPLVTGVRLTGATNNEVAVTIAHPGGSKDTVAVIYQNGAAVAQSAPLTGGGAGETAPVGPFGPGNYIAKACEIEPGTGYPAQCCETGEGYPFSIAG